MVLDGLLMSPCPATIGETKVCVMPQNLIIIMHMRDSDVFAMNEWVFVIDMPHS